MPQYKQFPLADTAEGLTEADILEWRVNPGDEVTVNQIVVEVETAKAAVELPIPWAGVVTELLVEAGQTVEVGAPILTIDVEPNGAAQPETPTKNSSERVAQDADATQSDGSADEEMKPLVGYGSARAATTRRARKTNTTTASEPKAEVSAAPMPRQSTAQPVKAKPPVRKLAKELGVALTELASTKNGAVITRDDVEQAAHTASSSTVDRSSSQRERREPIKSVRKATAQAMVRSSFTAPHVTEFLTIDVTPMLELRKTLSSTPAFRDIKLTPLTFAAKAVCLAIQRTPDVNATWEEDSQEIVYKNYVNLGIAAATPRGLVVPNVKNAEQLNLVELARALEELTITAREGKTAPADMLGGSITITNIGIFGVDTGTPIINPGESAILALGAIRDTPWVLDGELAVRKVMQLSLSFDHRVVDGKQGSEFLADVGALLANPAIAITY